VIVDAIDDHAAAFYRHFDFHQLDDRRLSRRLADVATPPGRITPRLTPSDGLGFASPASRLCSGTVWWQWTNWPRRGDDRFRQDGQA
jgi:hypothetical protein